MKKKNLTALILTAALCMGLALSGCSGKEEEPEETEPEEPAMQEIGDPSASLKTQLTNKLGGTITGLSVKKPEKAAYPANLMLTDQEIADDETVQFFYDPEGTEKTTVVITDETDANSSEEADETADAAILPDTEAVGYWNMAGDTDEELTIWDVSDDVVTFRLWWKDKTRTRDLMVSLNSGNAGTFAGVIGDDSMISGTLIFTETAITLDIEQYTYEGINLDDGPFIFDEKHAQSWEYADSYETSETAAEEEAVKTEDTGDSYMLKVTMADDTTYELSSFDLADMGAADLCLEDETAYLEYVSLTTGTEVSTREQEETIRNEKEAARPVIEQISQIGAASEENKEAVQAARKAYNSLAGAEQAYVTNEAALRWKEISLDTESEEEDTEPEDTEDEEEEEYEDAYDWDDEDENDEDQAAQDQADQENEARRRAFEGRPDHYDDYGNDQWEGNDWWGDGWN